jgi:hypothetical protein
MTVLPESAMRHKAIALILAVTALVPACVDPVEPRVHDVPATVSLASESAANDGAHGDTLGRNAKGTFTYRVCNAGTTTCSLPVTVTF